MLYKAIGDVPAAKLLGMQNDMNNKLRSGALSVEQWERFLMGQNPFAFPESILLGTFKDKDEIQKAIDKSHRASFLGGTDDLLRHSCFYLETSETTVTPVVLSAASLGFKKKVTKKKLWETASEHGFDNCPPEFPIQLRLQYLNQPKGEHLTVATELFPKGEDSFFLLRVLHAGTRVLSKTSFDYHEFSEVESELDRKWVFLKSEDK